MASTQFVRPVLPASVVSWVGEQSLSVGPNDNTVVAIIGTADWGPMGTDQGALEKPYPSLSSWEGSYGTNPSPGRTAVVGAFDGIGTSQGGGAGGIYFYRLGTSAAAAATKTVQNTDTTPVAAFKLDALYKGTRGNDISYAIEIDPLDVTKNRLRILFRGATMETYSYPTTDVEQLAQLVNSRPSRYAKATSLVTGKSLELTPGTALAGGDDGDTVTSTDFTAAQTALTMKNFTALAVAGLTDVAIKVQIAGWQRASADAQRPFRLVFGGETDELLSDVISELTTNPTLRDEQIIRVGVGTWHDDLLDMDLSTAEIAPRIAGVLAARGESASLTNAPLGAIKSIGASGPTEDDRVVARDQGITVFKSVAFAEAEIAISEGVTTYVDKTKDAKPYELFSEPRLIGILNRIQRYLSNWGEETIVGQTVVTDDTRAEVRKEVLKTLGQLESTGLAEPNSSYVIVEPNDDPGLRGAIPYEFGFEPTETAKYLIGVGKIRL